MASQPTFRERIWARLGPALAACGPVAAKAGGIVVVVVLCGLAVRGLWRKAVSLEQFRVCPAMVHIPVPKWAKPKLVEEIRNRPDLRKVYSIFQWDLTETIAHSYLRIPWVREVHSINKDFPNRIHIQFSLRKPEAVVKIGTRYEMIDEGGVVLPRCFYHWPSDKVVYPFIQCSGEKSFPQPGSRWTDFSVQVGLRLLHFLRKAKAVEPLKLTAVDVSRVRERSAGQHDGIILWNEWGVQIKWGGPDDHGSYVTGISDWRKLQSLYSVVRAEGPNVKSLEYIDVRWESPLARHKDGATGAALSRSNSG